MKLEPIPSKPGIHDGFLDPGIADIVNALREHGVETYESCEAGPGHCFPDPTVRFHGGNYEGLRALSVAMMLDLKPRELRRVWTVRDGEATGPAWEMTFATGNYCWFTSRVDPLATMDAGSDKFRAIADILSGKLAVHYNGNSGTITCMHDTRVVYNAQIDAYPGYAGCMHRPGFHPRFQREPAMHYADGVDKYIATFEVDGKLYRRDIVPVRGGTAAQEVRQIANTWIELANVVAADA